MGNNEVYKSTLAGKEIQTELIIDLSPGGYSFVRYYPNGPEGDYRTIGEPVRNASLSAIKELRTLARGYVR